MASLSVRHLTIDRILRICPSCGESLSFDYSKPRTVITTEQILNLTLKVYRCHSNNCPLYKLRYRPEFEGRMARPKTKFTFMLMAALGFRRGSHSKTYRWLSQRHVPISLRSVQNVYQSLERFLKHQPELSGQIQKRLVRQRCVILDLFQIPRLALVLRDWISGTVFRVIPMQVHAYPSRILTCLNVNETIQRLPVPIVAIVCRSNDIWTDFLANGPQSTIPHFIASELSLFTTREALDVAGLSDSLRMIVSQFRTPPAAQR